MNTMTYLIPAVFLLNIPCGFWRQGLKKLSPLWFVAIHLPIPFIVAARIMLNIHLSGTYFLLVVPAYLIGQKLGAILRRKRQTQQP
jgi:hypothetical protein